MYIAPRPKVPKGYKKPTRNIYHYRFAGCWKDRRSRAIRKFLGRIRGKGAIMTCFRRALRGGYKMFALQAGSECRGAKSIRRYKKYGRSRNCRGWRGGKWANDVYLIGRGEKEKLVLCRIRGRLCERVPARLSELARFAEIPVCLLSKSKINFVIT